MLFVYYSCSSKRHPLQLPKQLKQISWNIQNFQMNRPSSSLFSDLISLKLGSIEHWKFSWEFASMFTLPFSSELKFICAIKFFLSSKPTTIWCNLNLKILVSKKLIGVKIFTIKRKAHVLSINPSSEVTKIPRSYSPLTWHNNLLRNVDLSFA